MSAIASEKTGHLMIDVRGLNKSFLEQRALKDVSFELEKGRILAIIGPSGSGKSTLLRILCQLEKQDSGEVFVDGLRLNESKDVNRIILSKTGLVFQSFNLFPHLTVLGNITLAYKFLNKKCSGKEVERIACDLLERVCLADKAEKYPCMLSGGESQRAAIARSLALKPEVMFFDEPTSALDLEMVKNLSTLLKKIRTEENNTLVIVTHDVNFAKAVSDDVLFLDKGDMVFFGRSSDVFDSASGNDRIRRFLESTSL